MGKIYGNVVLITGASSGIGKAISEFLMKKGYKVYGTSRKQQTVNKADAESGSNEGFFKMIQLDVCSENSVKAAVDYVVKEEGAIDVLINNAGFGIAGAVEDTTPDEAFKQFDTNFFGVHRMCRHVVTVMRRQKRGLVINICSVAGLISIPFQSMYSASKYALEAMSEVLRMEVGPFGIKVVLVEPGDTKTGFTGSRQFTAAAKKGSIYDAKFTKAIDTMIKDEMNGPGPEAVVRTVARIMNMKNPPVRKIVGFSYKVFIFLKRILPARFVEYVVAKLYFEK